MTKEVYLDSSMKDINICIFGASITWGAYDAEKGGWVDRLKLWFFVQDENNYAEVYNLGVPGATTNDLIKRIEIESEARKPNIIVFSIGNNDSFFEKSKNENQIRIEKFAENLEKLFLKAQKYTDKIVFVGLSGVDETKTTPVYWNKDAYYTNADINRYDSEIEKFCGENNLPYISLKNILHPGDWEDGLHPNAEGHEKIYKKVQPEILDVFQEAKK
jgi:lysophospholipase L1-like esterase